MTLIPATDGSQKTWAHRGETVVNAVDALKVLHDIDAINRRKSEDLDASRRDRGVGKKNTSRLVILRFCFWLKPSLMSS